MNDAKPIPYWRLLAGVNRTQSWRRLKSAVAHSRLHAFLMGLFVLSYALLAYALFHKALQFTSSFPGLGPVLIERMMFLLFAFLFLLLLLSNVIINFTNLFRNRETHFLLSLPVPHQVVYRWKIFESGILASWAFLFLIAPLVAAYGTTYNAPWHFYFVTPLFVALFVVLPAILGSWAAIGLARWLDRLAFQVAAVLAVIVLGQYLIRPVFRFVIASRLREMETAMALLIVVGIASLMILVGLPPALGTFLAGVMLARSEFRHELEAQIEPFKGLLLGLFFITVGAGMDFAMLADRPLPILTAAAALIAVKAAILWVIARSHRMDGRARTLFTLSLAQAGEFGFVLVSYAVVLLILPADLAKAMLLVIALSMLATPLLFILYDQATRRIGDARAEEQPDAIDEQQPIIIAGIGRFGQVVNRLVSMSGFRTTVLDHDLKLIQLMRQFGFKGYFGDPSRPEILTAAGLDKARILVAALDDPEANLKLIRYARERRPDLHIIARARDRVNVYQLHSAGANDIVRETFDSSLRAGRYVLENAGLSEYEASELEKIFYRLDRASLRELAEIWKPGLPLDQNEAYITRSRELNRTLEAALLERFAEKSDPYPAGADEADPEHGLGPAGPGPRPGGRF